MKKITQNVNKDKIFNDLPKVKPVSSTWGCRSANYQACNLGEIVPIYYEEVLPGQRKKRLDSGMCSHTTTPIAPIFNSMYTEIRSFFVPMRLCADLLNGYKDRKSPWVKVFGEDNASASSQVIVPLANQKLPDLSTTAQGNFGTSMYNVNTANKDNIFDSLDIIGAVSTKAPNYLQLAAYELIYQRHYRNENYEAATDSPLYKLLFNAYNTTASVSISGGWKFEMANREKDYFTGAKPFTQKGSALEVGLTGNAPIIGATSTHSVGSTGILFEDQNGASSGTLATTNTGKMVSQHDSIVPNFAIQKTNLVADLSSVNGVSIEELRLLIKTQELLEKDAIYGSLYAESLNAHFGTCPLDLTLQDPVELKKVIITSNMQAIFQTSSTSGESSILGTIGANSTTQTDPFMIVPQTEFKEHGILMICAVHKLQNVYASEYFKPKFIYKKSRFDFYTPELNDLGYQPVTSDEMRSSSNPIAGYNEAFAEYRYKFNKVHGSLASQFPYWAPAIENEYSSISALYKEGAGILDKALSVASSTAPQFYDAWGFEEVDEKPMTLHSIPGMDGVI